MASCNLGQAIKSRASHTLKNTADNPTRTSGNCQVGPSGKEDPGSAESITTTVNITKLCETDSQTQIGQEIRENDPWRVEEVLEVDGDGNQ
ncbi:hypothetical protein RRF57_009620 [Xylaria bambusicola]|uniref:Uncharacterized protein n=1 Tax=Xylaria bambusicola TaxID=326684 RepID=A0AAN7ZC25_9PEZI